MNGFDKNVQFTIHLLENEVLHFLDLEMELGRISIFGKDTNTGLYAIYTSFVHCNHRTAWIRSLVTPALEICSSNKLSQVKINQNLPNFTKKHKEPLAIYFRFPYYGDQGFQLLKSCISKIKFNCKNDQPVVFTILYDVWSSLVIPNSELLLSINLFLCTNSRVLAVEQITWKNQENVIWTMCWAHMEWSEWYCENHLNQCFEVQYLRYITSLGPALFSDDNNIGITDHVNSRISLGIDNAKIINRYKNFSILLFKEEGKVNEIKATLNTALKASKKLQLFIVYCNVLLSCHQFKWCMLMGIELLEVNSNHIKAVIFFLAAK